MLRTMPLSPKLTTLMSQRPVCSTASTTKLKARFQLKHTDRFLLDPLLISIPPSKKVRFLSVLRPASLSSINIPEVLSPILPLVDLNWIMPSWLSDTVLSPEPHSGSSRTHGPPSGERQVTSESPQLKDKVSVESKTNQPNAPPLIELESNYSII